MNPRDVWDGAQGTVGHALLPSGAEVTVSLSADGANAVLGAVRDGPVLSELSMPVSAVPCVTAAIHSLAGGQRVPFLCV
jgi:hypothetical protein